MKKTALVWMLTSVLCAATNPAAALPAQPLPATRQAAMLARVLGYCSGVCERADGTVMKVAIVYKPSDSQSETSRKEMVKALEKIFRNVRIKGLRGEVISIPYRSASDLETQLASHSVDVVYVTPSLGASISSIAKLTRRTSRLTIAGNEAYVTSGLAIGLIARGSRPTILINLPATRAESAKVHAGLLRIAEVIK